jgi:hypothetical protein
MFDRRHTALEDYSGYVFPYFWPEQSRAHTYRLRRDNPPVDAEGKSIDKYIGERERPPHLYLVPGTLVAWLLDTALPIKVVEGEKKALALYRIALSLAVDGVPPFLVIGLSGVWSWKGTIGKTTNEIGARVPIKGALNDFERLALSGREVTIFFDSNVHSNKKVRDARREFWRFLQDECGASVWFADTPELPGVNGPDDLAYLHGDDAVIEALANRYRPRGYRSPIRKRTPEEIRQRAKKLRDMASPEEKASAVVGAKFTKKLARLMAVCNLSAGSRDLIFTLLAMANAQGSLTELKFKFKELYSLLHNSDNAFDAMGKLKSYPRKQIRERFDKLESEQAVCRVRFVYLTEGHIDDDENLIDSHVQLFAQQHVSEIEAMAEDDSQFKRGYRNPARDRATKAWVKEQACAAYFEKQRPRKDKNRQIDDGLKRAEGTLKATIERMLVRKDDPALISKAVLQVAINSLASLGMPVPDDFSTLIRINNKTGDTDEWVNEIEEDNYLPDQHAEPLPVEPQKSVTSEQVITQTESTDDHAQNRDFTTNNTGTNSELSDSELWERIERPAREAQEAREAEQARERERILSQPMPTPEEVEQMPEWDSPHSDQPPDEFELPALKCDHCGAPLVALATTCKAGCSYTPHYWQVNAKELGLVRPAIWHTGEADHSVTVRLPAIRGEDGQRYVFASGIESPIPVDEIEIKRGEK